MRFYVVATPIGNLSDLTFRAKQILEEVDIIVCEDTRQTKKLLQYYQIESQLFSWHQHSSQSATLKIIKWLQANKSIAYVVDAGTPAISDPGGRLVAEILSRLPDVEIVPIPGPSAVTAILSVAGMPVDKFQFLGFIPHKKGRNKFIAKLKQADIVTVFYESVHRINKLLSELEQELPDRQIVVGRELTKQFESIYRGTAIEIKKKLAQDKCKGEFVIVVDKKDNN